MDSDGDQDIVLLTYDNKLKMFSLTSDTYPDEASRTIQEVVRVAKCILALPL
jgi:hypothetical protein